MWFGSVPPHDKKQLVLASFVKRVIYFLFGWPNYLRRLQWASIREFMDIEPNITILDIGAGELQYSIEIAKLSKLKVIALDLGFLIGASTWAQSRGIFFINSRGESMPLSDNSVDRILLSSVLHMVQNPVNLLRECRRVLKPNGHLVISVPNHYQFISILFSWRISRKILVMLGFPGIYSEFIDILNGRFNVLGPIGYYSIEDLESVLLEGGFRIDGHKFSPGIIGSLIWEIGVLIFFNFGGLAFIGLFIFYPFAKFCENLFPSNNGSEHVLKACHFSNNVF